MGFLDKMLDRLADGIAGRIPEVSERQAYRDVRQQPRTFSVEATVSDALANLACGGFKMPVTGESERARIIRRTADEFASSRLAETMSLAFVTGDVLVVPTWDGEGFSNAIVPRDQFKLEVTNAGRITAAAFVVDESKARDGVVWRLVECMRVERYRSVGGEEMQGVRITLHVARNEELSDRRHTSFPQWEGYDGDVLIPATDRLPIARYKSFQRDKMAPNAKYGVPICYGASQPIREIHYLLDQLHAEFELSEKAVMADKRMFVRDPRGGLSMPRGRDRLYTPTMGGSVDETFWREWAPTIQAAPYMEALEVQKREVERCIGVDSGILSHPNDMNYQNVDNVRKSTRNTQAFVSRARGVADGMLDELLRAWDVLLSAAGVPTGDYEHVHDWSDEYIDTFADMRDALVAGYSMGATDAVDYRSFVLEEPPEVARERVAEIAAGRMVSLVGEE